MSLYGHDISAGVRRRAGSRLDVEQALRAVVIGAGLFASMLFVVVGLRAHLHLYGDGAIFSYSIAVQDAWNIHWHNISGRLTVYLLAHLPAQAYVTLTGHVHGGVLLYSFIFFSSPFLSLAATYALDRSRRKTFFTFACLSTTCLCPLIFGFPTEMWIAHALFWPTLALCHYAQGRWSLPAVFGILLALVFSHEGAIILAASILFTLSLRGLKNPQFLRAAGAFLAVLAIWICVKMTIQPDPYIARFIHRAAMQVFNPEILETRLLVVLVLMLAGYGALAWTLRAFDRDWAAFYAATLVAAGLVIYWLGLDVPLHTDDRYYLRTALIVLLPPLGLIAAVVATDGRNSPWPSGRRLLRLLSGDGMARAFLGALALVLFVHTVETVRFVEGWDKYLAAVRSLAMSVHSDPELGSSRFVSANRIPQNLDPLAWYTTTPYLSIMTAPEYRPARLVIDPNAQFFWLSCKTATEIARLHSEIPAASRNLVRKFSCMHR